MTDFLLLFVVLQHVFYLGCERIEAEALGYLMNRGRPLEWLKLYLESTDDMFWCYRFL